jgi:hypothetical protein
VFVSYKWMLVYVYCKYLLLTVHMSTMFGNCGYYQSNAAELTCLQDVIEQKYR